MALDGFIFPLLVGNGNLCVRIICSTELPLYARYLDGMLQGVSIFNDLSNEVIGMKQA